MADNKTTLTDAEIKKALECCKADNDFANCDDCPYYPKGICLMCSEVADLINRLEADKEALIAGQETLQKALAEKNAEIENQSQNLKMLVSDHRTLQQSFDNLKCLYEDEKSKVEKAKEKSIYFAKELQTAKADNEGLKKLLDDKCDRCIAKERAEAVKEFAEKLKNKAHRCDLSTDEHEYYSVGVIEIDNLVKEMVGDAE